MIREILERLFIRQSSYSDIEKELNIDHATLLSRIEMLIHLGYLTRKSMQMDGCEGGCMHCSQKTETSCADDGNGKGKSLMGYELTHKGRRIVEKSGIDHRRDRDTRGRH